MTLRNSPAAVAMLGLLSVCACAASRSEEVQTASQAPKASTEEPNPETPPASTPFMIREASLPRGFPPPGPVGTVIVKDYPAYRMARVQAGGTGSRSGPNQMFGPLFNHIKRHDIAMTAPVEMEYAKASMASTPASPPAETRAATSMSFLYANPSLGSTGPDQADRRVMVEDVPPMTVVSVSVRGDYTPERLEEGVKTLRSWLAENSDRFRVAGSPRYLGYNSPFVLGFLKLGEVQIPVERTTAAGD